MSNSAFSRLALILALTALIVWVYWPSPAFYLVQWSDFRDITFTHGWLIVAVCVALLFRARRAIGAAPARPNLPAQAALAVCILAWLVCYRASIEELHVTIFPAILWLACLAIWGWPLARELAFPVAFFYFAVPSWAQVGGPLQALTVKAVHVLLAVTGPTAVINGDTIHIPNGTFIIEEGCSGLHFMIVGLAVAALHGELRNDPWRTRLRQLALMTLLALLANWLRVYIIIEAGYLTDMHSYLVAVSHYWFGWGVFAVALVIFFWLTAGPAPADAPTPPGAVAPQASSVATAAVARALTLAVALLVGLPASSAVLRQWRPAATLTAPVLQPRAPWLAVAPDIRSRWLPEFPGAHEQRRFAFARADGGMPLEGYSVVYGPQRDGAELVGTGDSLFGRWLVPLDSDVVQSALGAFTESQVADRRGQRSLIWSRHQVDGTNILAPLGEQLWYGLTALVAQPSAALLAVRAACEPDCAAARATLADFAAHAAVH